jgi:scyllo-inositol 2-dehydrogenase (NADP+)
VLEFDDVLFQVETSRICRTDRPRWWILAANGGFVKYGIDPQEDALRSGDIDAASEPPERQGVLRFSESDGTMRESRIDTVRGHWDSYYLNVAEAIDGRAALAVTAEEAREVVRILEAALQSSREHRVVMGPWASA